MSDHPPVLSAFGSPARYLQGPGALHHLPMLVDEFRAHRPLLVCDDFVHQMLCTTLPALAHWPRHPFAGECTADEIAAVTASYQAQNCDLLIGAGGGKSIDAAKAAQISVGGPVFIVPTVASTDAPTSRVAVVYTADHRLDTVRSMRANPDVVLVDSAILARAPRRFFVSGLGDALSKKFEMAQCIAAGGINFYKGRPTGLTQLIGEASFNTLMADTTEALTAVAAGVPNAAFERVLEATILLSGLAFENGGLSVAHSLTRGLSAVPALHGSLHGEEVAYGLIVQLLLDGDAAQAALQQLLPYYRQTGLPRSLTTLGVAKADVPAAVQVIAERTVAAAPHLKHFSRPLGVHDLMQAMLAAESLAA